MENSRITSLSEVFSHIDCISDPQMLESIHSLLAEHIHIKLEQDLSRKVVEGYAEKIKRDFSSSKLLAIRSSSNMEDLSRISGAGLFYSQLNVPSKNIKEISSAIKSVWKSLYSRKAVQSRRKYGIRQEVAAMGVLVQEMVLAECSFIIHTFNPVLLPYIA
jgi:phosphoglucan,water dikinase